MNLGCEVGGRKVDLHTICWLLTMHSTNTCRPHRIIIVLYTFCCCSCAVWKHKLWYLLCSSSLLLFTSGDGSNWPFWLIVFLFFFFFMYLQISRSGTEVNCAGISKNRKKKVPIFFIIKQSPYTSMNLWSFWASSHMLISSPLITDLCGTQSGGGYALKRKDAPESGML